MSQRGQAKRQPDARAKPATALGCALCSKIGSILSGALR